MRLSDDQARTILRCVRQQFGADAQVKLFGSGALRAQVAKLETNIDTPRDGDYVGKYREFKYQETLFELFSLQYELAWLDESREGASIQVVDVATKPEWKSKPKRWQSAMTTTLAAAIFLFVCLLARQAWRRAAGAA